MITKSGKKLTRKRVIPFVKSDNSSTNVDVQTTKNALITSMSTGTASAKKRTAAKKSTGKRHKGNKQHVSLNLASSAVIGHVPGLGEEEEEEDEKKETRKLIMEHNRKKKKSGGFQAMGLSPNIFNGIIRKGYKIPTPIQRKTIPLLMDGRDVVAMARTGSGKTAAFLIPLLERLRGRAGEGGAGGARALILSPTRELSLQTLKFTRELGKFTGLKPAVILGGDKMEDQFAAIHESPDILIATPGRFMHVLVEMELKLNRIEYVVFDEADRLFELGFSEQLQEILRRLPDCRQAALFSATLPKKLVEFASAGLNEPTLVRLDVDTKLSENLEMAFLECRSEDKMAALLHILTSIITPKQQTLVFVATKHHVEYLQQLLSVAGIACSYSYSSLDPTARKIQVAKFRAKKTSVLIVTDLAARGIDIPLLDHVINYNVPAKPKLFVHRVGRVARAGKCGTAFTLVIPEEIPYVLDLHLFLGRAMTHVVPGKSYEGSKEALYGRVPQSVLDDEADRLRSWHGNTDVSNLQRVASNAYKHYVRSRPAPSNESVKRVKQLADLHIGYHPLFKADDSNQGGTEESRVQLLDAMRTYRPPTTIFEVNSTNRTQASRIMRSKRNYHGDVISRNLIRQEQAAETRQSVAMETVSTAEGSTEGDLQVAFSRIVAPKRPTTDRPFQTKGKRRPKETGDEENYISYQSTDYQTEKGLSLSGTANFEREMSNATLDLYGDDTNEIRKSQNQMKWDRKRKRFVHETGKTDGKKRIKTESGAWISSSYKSNLYKDWLEKNKVVEFEDEEEVAKKPPHGGRWRKKGNRNAPQSGKDGQKREGHAKGRDGKQKGRSELKSVDEILKNRRQKAKKQNFQKGREQLRNKRRAMAGEKRK